MRQKGFTLIEVLVMMAVSGVLLTGLVTTIFQVSTFIDRSNSQGIALTDVHRAAFHIKKDLQMAQNTGIVEGDSVVLSPQSSVTLEWIDCTSEFQPEEERRNHASTYNLTDSGELKRTYDNAPTPSIIARHITYLRFAQQDEKVVNVVITATGPEPHQRSKTIEFIVHTRSEELP